MKRTIPYLATLIAFAVCSAAWSQQPDSAPADVANANTSVIGFAVVQAPPTNTPANTTTNSNASLELPAANMALWQSGPQPIAADPIDSRPIAIPKPTAPPQPTIINQASIKQATIKQASAQEDVISLPPGQPGMILPPGSRPVIRDYSSEFPPAGIAGLPGPAQPFGPSTGPLAGSSAGAPPSPLPVQTVQAAPVVPGDPAIPPVPAGPVVRQIQLPPAEQKLIPIPEPQAVKPGESVGPFQILDKAEDLEVIVHRSKLLRSQVDITRTVVVDPNICDLQQYTTREFGFIGKTVGTTQVTIWFRDRDHEPPVDIAPRTFVVHVRPDPDTLNLTLRNLEAEIAKLFPNSKVHLRTFGTRILVMGQARDVSEAAEILLLIRGESVDESGRWVSGAPAPGSGGTGGGGARPRRRDNFTLAGSAANTDDVYASSDVVNLLKVPGVHQVLLRVKIAELSRTAGRSFGSDFKADIAFTGGTLLIQSLLNAGNSRTIIGNFDNNKLNFGLYYLEQHGVVRLLSEPTLVTLSGKPANFIAGGEFPVPTVVGLGGASAATTDFRAYGSIISFTPYVLDKDLIRLDVNPEFSQIDASTGNNGVPGLTTRTLTTTVEMRAGQTLALGGLLDESMKTDTSGDLPWIGKLIGTRNASRSETEIIILVTPELVHPMEPEEVPPLPGFDVTEPDNVHFYLYGDIEGVPTMDYRSTVWPNLQQRYRAGGTPMIDGPFGHSNVWQNDASGASGPSAMPPAH